MTTPTKPEPIAKTYQIISYGLGLFAAGIAVVQMVSFEEFASALQDYGLGINSIALAIMLIALEIFSVPFLFRLSLSPLARLLSALCVVLLPCAWTLLTALALTSHANVPNAGYLGGFADMRMSGLVLLFNVSWLTAVGFGFGQLGGYKALKPRQ